MADTSITETVTINGLNDIQETIELKPLEIKPLEIKPLTVTSHSDFTIPAPIVTDATNKLAITQPIITDSKSDSASKLDLLIEPIKVESDQKSAIDVKPLVIDTCQTTRLAPLPPTAVEQPYHHHFGLTLMGIELWGINLSGNSQMNIRNPRSPQFHETAHHGPCKEPSPAEPERPKHGLRVRVGGTQDKH